MLLSTPQVEKFNKDQKQALMDLQNGANEVKHMFMECTNIKYSEGFAEDLKNLSERFRANTTMIHFLKKQTGCQTKNEC